MDINQLKTQLEEEKIVLEKELKNFADKDRELKDDWDTRFPDFGEENDSPDLEGEAGEVEEYTSLLPVEHALEIKLKDINLALEKIKNNQFGKCEECNQKLEEELLKILPETRICLKCKNSNR